MQLQLDALHAIVQLNQLFDMFAYAPHAGIPVFVHGSQLN